MTQFAYTIGSAKKRRFSGSGSGSGSEQCVFDSFTDLKANGLPMTTSAIKCYQVGWVPRSGKFLEFLVAIIKILAQILSENLDFFSGRWALEYNKAP